MNGGPSSPISIRATRRPPARLELRLRPRRFTQCFGDAAQQRVDDAHAGKMLIGGADIIRISPGDPFALAARSSARRRNRAAPHIARWLPVGDVGQGRDGAAIREPAPEGAVRDRRRSPARVRAGSGGSARPLRRGRGTPRRGSDLRGRGPAPVPAFPAFRDGRAKGCTARDGSRRAARDSSRQTGIPAAT